MQEIIDRLGLELIPVAGMYAQYKYPRIKDCKVYFERNYNKTVFTCPFPGGYTSTVSMNNDTIMEVSTRILADVLLIELVGVYTNALKQQYKIPETEPQAPMTFDPDTFAPIGMPPIEEEEHIQSFASMPSTQIPARSMYDEGPEVQPVYAPSGLHYTEYRYSTGTVPRTHFDNSRRGYATCGYEKPFRAKIKPDTPQLPEEDNFTIAD